MKAVLGVLRKKAARCLLRLWPEHILHPPQPCDREGRGALHRAGRPRSVEGRAQPHGGRGWREAVSPFVGTQAIVEDGQVKGQF